MTEQSQPQEAETLAVPIAELRPALEAVLMVADQPLDEVALATAVGFPVVEVTQALTGLAQEYDEQQRGFELRVVAGGWRYYTREAFAPVVERFVLEGQQARLTQAALETLAVVAYRQPVSRARVSAVRGVNVDGVMRTLLSRGLVEEAGADQVTGAHLYRTTSYFLERIGVRGLDDLPDLAPFLPELEEMDELEELGTGGEGSMADEVAREDGLTVDEPPSAGHPLEDAAPPDEGPDEAAESDGSRGSGAGFTVTTAGQVADSGGLMATALEAVEGPTRPSGWDRFEQERPPAPSTDAGEPGGSADPGDLGDPGR